MTEYKERSLDDLTEEPTAHRIEELRAQGIVPHSRELTSTIVLLGVMVVLYFLTGTFVKHFTELLKEVFTKDLVQPFAVADGAVFASLASRYGKFLFMSFLPIGFVAVLCATLGSLLQVGFLFSTNSITPNLDRVNPVSGFTKIFSFRSLILGFKSALKIVVIIWAVYSAVAEELTVLSQTSGYGIHEILFYTGTVAAHAFAKAAALLLFVSVFDYWLERRRYLLQARMTKAEAKRDLKEREGDPQIKARMSTIQREMLKKNQGEVARNRMLSAVPRANVIITCKDETSVALFYNSQSGTAPKVIAKGVDKLADRINCLATEHGIPSTENEELARSLYKNIKVGQMIPRSQYQEVAEILARAYELSGKKDGASEIDFRI